MNIDIVHYDIYFIIIKYFYCAWLNFGYTTQFFITHMITMDWYC